MARPVQHEINNLLTVVLANLELLRRGAAEGAPRRQLDRVAEATRRLEVVTRAVLSLARRGVADAEGFAPAAAIGALRPLLALLLPAANALSLDVPEGAAATVVGDRALFEDALLNALAAIGTAGPVRISLAETADAVELRLQFAAAVPEPVMAALAPLAAAEDGACGVLMRMPRDQPGAP